MRIEFRTVYDEIANEQLADLYVKYFMDKQLKQLKNFKISLVIICVLGFIIGVLGEDVTGTFIPFSLFPCFLVFGLVYLYLVKKKIYPKAFIDINKIGCPYNVTFGLYDEYFYEKFENNMLVSENSIRYEFLKKVVETPEYFVLMTNRSQIFFLPKRDMGYEAVLEFSAFCKLRLGHIYMFKG